MRQWLHFSRTVIALLLALGLAMPVMADTGEGSSTQSSGAITLADRDCSITVRSGDMNFGWWTWNGTEYQTESGQVISAVKYQVTPPNNRRCQITIQTAGLVHTEEGSDARIGPEHFSVEIIESANGDPVQVQFGDDGTVVVPWAIRVNTTGISIGMMSVPNDVPSGEYEGKFIFTISSAP